MKIREVLTRTVKIAVPEDPLKGTAGLHGTVSAPGGQANSEYHKVPPYRSFYSSKIQTFLVKIVGDDGTVGVGECQSPVVPEVAGVIVRDLLSPLLIGQDPLDVDVLWDRMYTGMSDRGHTTGFMLDAISAVDIALWDLIGKSLGLPVYKLLGGAYRTSVPVYGSGLSGATVEERVKHAREYVRMGLKAIKLFVGDDLDPAVEEVQAVRDAVGKEIRLMVDVQWLYSVPGAIKLGRALERLDVFWLETPVTPEDLAGQAEVCATLDLAIASGECERSRYQFRDWLVRRAVDIVQPDVGRAGGITECHKIVTLAQTFNVPCALHLGVGLAGYIAASLQVAAATPNLLYVEYQPPMHELANRLIQSPFVLENGALHLPTSPGLGIDLKETALDALTGGTPSSWEGKEAKRM